MSKRAEQASSQLARQLLVEAREELTRADGKASILLAATGIAVGALMAALLAGTWSPFVLSGATQALWWIGVLAAAGAISALAIAVYPRSSPKNRPPRQRYLVAYYGDVVRARSTRVLKRRITQTASDPDAAVVDQLGQVCRIVSSKYKAIRVALWLLAASAFTCTASALIEKLLYS